MKKTFIRTTAAIKASHPAFKKAMQVGVDYYQLPTGEIQLITKSGFNSSTISKAGAIVITPEEYKEIPESPYNSLIEARAALRMLGWEPCI